MHFPLRPAAPAVALAASPNGGQPMVADGYLIEFVATDTGITFFVTSEDGKLAKMAGLSARSSSRSAARRRRLLRARRRRTSSLPTSRPLLQRARRLGCPRNYMGTTSRSASRSRRARGRATARFHPAADRPDPTVPCHAKWPRSTSKPRSRKTSASTLTRSRPARLLTCRRARRLPRGWAPQSLICRASFLLTMATPPQTERCAASVASASSSTWRVTCSMPCRSFIRARTARITPGPAATSSTTTCPLIASKPDVNVQACRS